MGSFGNFAQSALSRSNSSTAQRQFRSAPGLAAQEQGPTVALAASGWLETGWR